MNIIDSTEKIPLKAFLLLIPFMIISSYLMFDIPFFLNQVIGYGFCDTGGSCTHLFTGHEYLMFSLGLFAMFNWQGAVIFMIYYFRKHPERLKS